MAAVQGRHYGRLENSELGAIYDINCVRNDRTSAKRLETSASIKAEDREDVVIVRL